MCCVPMRCQTQRLAIHRVRSHCSLNAAQPSPASIAVVGGAREDGISLLHCHCPHLLHLSTCRHEFLGGPAADLPAQRSRYLPSFQPAHAAARPARNVPTRHGAPSNTPLAALQAAAAAAGGAFGGTCRAASALCLLLAPHLLCRRLPAPLCGAGG